LRSGGGSWIRTSVR